MAKNMGFIILLASSIYGNAYPAFPKDYGFLYQGTPKILKEIFANFFSSCYPAFPTLHPTAQSVNVIPRHHVPLNPLCMSAAATLPPFCVLW